jgi:hypothetical protein
LSEGVAERGRSPAAGDELDEVVHPGLGAVELDALQPELLRDVRELLPDLLRGALVDELEDVGLEDRVVERRDATVATGSSRRRRASATPNSNKFLRENSRRFPRPDLRQER